MRFKISRASTVIIDGNVVDAVGYVVVECERWWDARHVGLLHFGCEVGELRFEVTSDDADVLTRWIGTDNGTALVRRMEYCAPGGAWRPIEAYNDDRLAAAGAAKTVAEQAAAT